MRKRPLEKVTKNVAKKGEQKREHKKYKLRKSDKKKQKAAKTPLCMDQRSIQRDTIIQDKNTKKRTKKSIKNAAKKGGKSVKKGDKKWLQNS